MYSLSGLEKLPLSPEMFHRLVRSRPFRLSQVPSLASSLVSLRVLCPFERLQTPAYKKHLLIRYNSHASNAEHLMNHIQNKMRPVSSPVFSAYPTYEPAFSKFFGSFLLGQHMMPSPDYAILCLDHPKFQAQDSLDHSSQPRPIEEILRPIAKAYGTPRVGDKVFIVEPEEDRIVKLELEEIKEETYIVTFKSGYWLHAGVVSRREMPKWSVFSGFPCVALLPSTPIRLLKKEIGGTLYQDRGLWPEAVDPRDICIECNGTVLDEELGVGSLMRLSTDARNDVFVVLGGSQRVRWAGRDHKTRFRQ